MIPQFHPPPTHQLLLLYPKIKLLPPRFSPCGCYSQYLLPRLLQWPLNWPCCYCPPPQSRQSIRSCYFPCFIPAHGLHASLTGFWNGSSSGRQISAWRLALVSLRCVYQLYCHLLRGLPLSTESLEGVLAGHFLKSHHHTVLFLNFQCLSWSGIIFCVCLIWLLACWNEQGTCLSYVSPGFRI